MTRVVERPFGFGGKLFMMILLAIAGGFVWAMIDTGRSFADVAKIIAPGDPAPVSTAPPASPTGPRPPSPPVPRPQPNAPVVPAPLPPGPVTYSPEKMAALFEEIDGHLKRGRIKEARELVRRQNASLVPAFHIEQFRRTEEVLGRYHQLMLETTPGAAIDLPLLAEMDLKSGGALVVKNLQEGDTEYRYETLVGIRSGIKKSSVTAVRRYPKDQGSPLVDEELERQASYRGIRIQKSANSTEWKFSDPPGSSVAGFSYFELADFCARNGRNSRIVPLFEEGLKRDPQLTATVFEKKAARFVDTFLYFIAIQSKEDAQGAYEVLKNRYGRSVAYRDRVEGDDEVRKMFAALFDTALAVAPKPAPPGPDSPAPPTPEPEPEPDQPPPSPPPGSPPAPPAPPPPAVPTPPKPVDDDPDRVDGAEPTILPKDAPSKAVDLVKKGDDLFKQALKHVLNSDSQKNPTGWVEENKKALKLLNEAFDKCYYPAQEVFEKAKKEVPRTLTKRVRHCQMTRVMCRKRDVAAR